MTDPRKNRPSASAFARYIACPGAFDLEQQAPEEPPDADSQSGTRVHDYLGQLLLGCDIEKIAEAGMMGLSLDECDMVIRCEKARVRFFEMVAMHYLPVRVDRERRLWALRPEDLSPLYSGQPDGVALWGEDLAAVWDFKTGRVPVPPAEINWQLRSLAALAAENYQVTERLVVAIIQPWVSPGLTVAEYSAKDIREAQDACEEVAVRALTPGQPRIPGEDQCRFCRAKAYCPEAAEFLRQRSQVTIADGPNGEVVDGRQLSKLLDALPLVRRLDKAIVARAKAMLAEHPDSVPGYRLKPGIPREKIVDVGGVWKRAAVLGIDGETFAKACSLTKKNATAMVRAATAEKGKALNNRVAALIVDCVDKKLTSPKLERLVASPDAIEEKHDQDGGEEGNGDE
jgi:hypothetical protein